MAKEASLSTEFAAARRDAKLALVEGFHALKHALRFGAEFERAVAVDPDHLQTLAQELAPELARPIADLVEPVEPGLFAALSGGPVETGVIAIARRPNAGISALLDPGAGPVVLLERPTHHGNVGAVIRVAAAAGAAGVLTTGPLDPWHPHAIRGSAGLHFALPVAQIETLPALDRPLVAIHPEGEALDPASLPAHAVYAFGSERRGLSPALLARADLRVAIPMRAGVSSLNLATAAAVVLYALRQGCD